MAERRMFAKTIVLSDAFLDMPVGARLLYFTFGMLADDEGFVNNPKAIMRQCGASEDDLKILLAKRYVLDFESGVIVIKHWKINNYLQNDRLKPTTYLEELNTLALDEKNAYVEKDKCIHSIVYTQSSVEESSVEESRVNNKHFTKPTIEELTEYCKDKGYKIDCEYFYNYYESKGWKVGNSPMKSWKAAISNWIKNERRYNNQQSQIAHLPDYDKMDNKLFVSKEEARAAIERRKKGL